MQTQRQANTSRSRDSALGDLDVHQTAVLYFFIWPTFSLVKSHRVASTAELATNFIDYKIMTGMTTVRKSCYYTVLSRRYALRWIYFYLNIFFFEIYTQQ